MNSYIIFTILVAATSAYQTYSVPSSVDYAKTGELYQSGLEQKPQTGADQSQGFKNGQQSYQNGADQSVKVLRHQHENNGHGYQYIYETENGIKAQEVGNVQGKSLSVQGEYSYTGTDGQTYTVTYTADENGFHPSGAHLPTPPPTPEAILKSLEQNAQQAANGVFDDGSYKESHSEEQAPQHESTYQQYQPQQVEMSQYQRSSHLENQYPQSEYQQPLPYQIQAPAYQPSYEGQGYQAQAPSYQDYHQGNGYAQAMAQVSQVGSSGYHYRQ